MNAVRREVKFDGDLKSFFKHLQDDPRYYYTQPSELISGYRDLQKKINGLLPKMFDIAPKQTTRCVRSKRFAQKVRPARRICRLRPMGHGPDLLYQYLQPEGAADLRYGDAVAARGISRASLPGGSIAQEIESLPKFRRFNTYYVAYSEGWALYAESIGKELGLFTDLYQWYGRLSDEQLRAMRLVVDTGLHHKGWSRQQAIDYMLANSSMAESDVVSEVERYMSARVRHSGTRSASSRSVGCGARRKPRSDPGSTSRNSIASY